LFVSLDGTLISTKTGNKYPLHSKDWKINTQVVNIIKKHKDKGYRIVIVSNQFGVRKGFFSERMVIEKLEAICAVIEKTLEITFNKLIYSYCIKEDNYYSLPNLGQIYELAIEHELNLKDSVVLGNTDLDKELSKNLNVEFIEVNYA